MAKNKAMDLSPNMIEALEATVKSYDRAINGLESGELSLNQYKSILGGYGNVPSCSLCRPT